MAAPERAEPFGAMAYDLNPSAGGARHIALAPIPASETHRLAARFAAIDPWARYGYAPARLAAFFSGSEPSAPRYALYADGDIAGIVGIVGLRLDWLRGPFLQFLGIIPEAQGQGFGHSVLAWIEREARRGHHRNLWVTASEFNSSAVRFYMRHDYEEAARLDGLVSDEHVEILFRKRLI